MVTDIKKGERKGRERKGKERKGKERRSQVLYQAAQGLTSTPPSRLEGMQGSDKYAKQARDPTCKTNCCS